VDSPGDNLLAEFASAVDAVQGAVTIQQELQTRNAALPAQRQMAYRICINVGDVVVEGERIYGDGVNIAARLESLADGGGVAISGTVYDQVVNKLDFAFTYQGEQAVKNITQPVRMYTIALDAPETSSSVEEQPEALPLPDKPSIAVLPFTNMSTDPEQEYFSDGMTEDIITDLSKISGLFVIARNSVFTYKGQAVDISEVGRKFGVRYVLEGSVRKASNRVRITAQLIEATTNGHLWAERYDRELDDIFTLQDEMTQQIVGALKVTLAPDESSRELRVPTNNLDAYDAFLRGAEAQRRFTQASMAEARQHFAHAITLDARYAEAYASLSWVSFLEWEWGWSTDPEQTFARFEESSQKAVELDETLAWARAMRGWALLWEYQYERAIAEGEQAVRLDPNSADAHWLVANVLRMAGQPEDALESLERAMRLDPRYPAIYLFSLGETYRALRQYPEAIAALKRSLSRAPDMEVAYRFLAVAYSEAGQEEDARAAAAHVLRLNPAFSVEAQRRYPSKDPQEVERIIDGLRKAGLE
jgi:adenylate cyclase